VRREEVVRIIAAHQADLENYTVKRLSLFGSVARGEAGPQSDVDLLVEFSQPVGLFALAALQDYLERILGAPVDLGMEQNLKARVRETVLQEVVSVI
jgi:predicted nucleotidyltransferase